MSIKKMFDESHKKGMMNLILSLYDGNVFSVGDFLKRYKKMLGSKKIDVPEMRKLYNLFYSVKNELESQGLLRKIKHGVFYVSTQGVEDYPESEDVVDSDSDDDATEGVLPSTVVVGEGGGEVYVFFYKIYEDMAKIMGQDRFRLKVGMTNIGCRRRFASGTDCPEHRYIALIIKTDRPAELEKLIHAALRLKGLQADSPGNEWFYSNVKEILAIYNMLVAA